MYASMRVGKERKGKKVWGVGDGELGGGRGGTLPIGVPWRSSSEGVGVG